MSPDISIGDGPSFFAVPIGQRPGVSVLSREWQDLALPTLLCHSLLHAFNFSRLMLLHTPMALLLQLCQPGVLFPVHSTWQMATYTLRQ